MIQISRNQRTIVQILKILEMDQCYCRHCPVIVIDVDRQIESLYMYPNFTLALFNNKSRWQFHEMFFLLAFHIKILDLLSIVQIE